MIGYFPQIPLVLGIISLGTSMQLFEVPMAIRRLALVLLVPAAIAIFANIAIVLLKLPAPTFLMPAALVIASMLFALNVYIACSFRPLRTRQ